MAGLFGLFGGKTKYVDDPQDEYMETQGTNGTEEAYFLAPDDAKTLGDIEFMRKPKTIKRSFPKTLSSGEGTKVVKAVSSMEKGEVKGGGEVSPSFTSSENSNGQSSPTVTPRRTASDNGMDMFRQMAKEIKK